MGEVEERNDGRSGGKREMMEEVEERNDGRSGGEK